MPLYGVWKFASRWGALPQEYIYKIECKGLIYIGQSKKNKKGNRIQQHLIHMLDYYSQKDSRYNVPELAEAARKTGLMGVKISYYSVDNNFGIPADLMTAFKKSYKKGNEEELNDIDAAEILHILYHIHVGNKIVNSSMGGQNGSLTLINDKGIALKKILTRTMSPSEAYQIFRSSEKHLQKFVNFRDFFNRIIFTDEWASYYKNFTENSEGSALAKQTYKELIISIQDYLTKAVAARIAKRGVGGVVSSDLDKIRDKIYNWYKAKYQLVIRNKALSNLANTKEIINIKEKKWFDDQQWAKIDDIVDYIYDVITNQLLSDKKMKEMFKDMIEATTGSRPKTLTVKIKKDYGYNEFSKSKGGKASTNIGKLKYSTEIIKMSTIFDLNLHETNTSLWWTLFNNWKPFGEIEVEEDRKKETSLLIFRRIFNKCKKEDFYTNRTWETFKIPFGADDQEQYALIAKRGAKKNDVANTIEHSTLSATLRDEYLKWKLTFIDGRWREFYGVMVSLVINSENPWVLYTDDNGEDFVTNESSEVTDRTTGEVYYLAFRPVFKVNWFAKSINDIKIY